tara:strand:- start:205 stop:534 length:330 start_codon:yes stop_codon:yes gene_type:complete
MNSSTFLSILKNFFKGLNDFKSEGRQGYISYDDKGSGTHTSNYTYNLISKLFSFIRESNVYSESGEKTRLDKYVKNKYYEKLGIQTSSNNKVEDDKAKITYGSDTKINK